ncbi:DUF7507 domain-containing protein [Agrococcus sp. SGAir0287]|uniref:DUF7507 domain-containing protein n=1 Tax=Agrococcus sp. SGAir0287 TaxID=2070347 RepID=UPI0010F54FEF|nr:LPXTG cell wall anchor domain-containing protein [Agrococcus sp. SGAir0287]
MPRPSRPSIGWRRKATAIVAVGALALSGFASVVGPTPASVPAAQAVPGTPGVAQDPTVVFFEDFDNTPGQSPIQRLTGYTGDTGQTYTAAPTWLERCNGWIVSAGQAVNAGPQVTDCGGQQPWNGVQQLARALGVYNGYNPPNTNFAVAAYTSNNPGANLVEFATASNITLPAASGRFLTFSVDVAAMNCPPVAGAPQLNFSVLDEAAVATPVGGTINPCASGQTLTMPALGVSPQTAVRVGTYTSNGSFLLDGASFGIVMRNANGSGSGNDHAFDNIRVLDVTPQLDKSFGDASIVRGETTTLTFTVTNTSELAAKSGWSFTDVLPAGMTIAGSASTTCPAGVVDAVPGDTEISVTGDLNAGQVSCTVTVDVTTDAAGTFVNGPDDVTSTGLNPPGVATLIVEEQAPALTLVKSSNAGTDAIEVGQVITYSFLVTNTGNIQIDDVAIVDEEFSGSGGLGAITCPGGAPSLAVGASVTCSVDYTVTQTDVDAGEIDNTATADGVALGGDPVTSNESSTTAPSAPAPALTIVKSADTEGPVSAGDEITYSFVVTNSGNVTITNLVVDDALLADADITVSCEVTALAPGEDTDCVADAAYVVTEDDLVSGSVDNAATANGTDPDGEPVQSPVDEVSVPTVEASAVLTIVKSADTEGPVGLGDEITYSFVVSNAGNVTVSTIAVDDDMLTAAGITVTCDAAELAPVTSTECVADGPYTVTESDLLSGSVDNVATATGTDPEGSAVESDPSDAIVPTAPVVAALAIEKSSDAGEVVSLGDEITYSFVLTNTGNVTIDDVVVIDDRLTAAGIGVTCEATSLAPGEDTDCVADAAYVVTEADLLAGEVENTASAEGTDATGAPVASEPDSVIADTEPVVASLSIEKSADTEGPATLGQEIVYAFVVTNTGNVTIGDVQVADDRLAAAGIGVTCEATSLAPGEDTDCVADDAYVVTEDDLLAGSVDNTATATGIDPTEAPVESEPDEVSVAAVAATPELTIDKSAEHDDANGNGAIDVGETILYSFVVTNTGNLTVDGVSVDDPMLAEAGITVTCEATTLAPGAVTLCVADEDYVIGQADVDAGQVVNVAAATGTPYGSDEPIVSATDATTTPGDVTPGIGSTKSAALDDRNGNGRADAGETIVFTVTVTNTGNVSLTDVAVADPLIAVSCPQTVLAPGASMDCVSQPYTVTAADVRAGEVVNTATATASTPGGTEVSTTTNTTRTPTAVAVPAPAPAPSLPQTATEMATVAFLVLGLLLAAGGALLVIRRRVG